MAVSDFISNGGFGMGSFNRAKQAGYSDLDIYNFLGGYRGTIGDQVRQNMSNFNQSQAQAQQGLGLQSYQRALASGQTPQQFFDYARGSGLTIGQGLQDEMNRYAAESQARPIKIKEAKGLNQALKIAGRTLSTKELKQITKLTKGGNPEKVLERAVNKGLVIGSKVVNDYQKGKYTDPMMAMTRAALPGFAMAAGKDSSILQQLRNSGKLDKGSGLFIGSKGSTATVLPRKFGTAGGGRPMTGGDYTPDFSSLGPGSGGETTTSTEPTPMMPETPVEESKYGPGGPGAALDGGATGFRPRRSRWRSAGKTTKGTGNLKIMGQSSRSSGVNLG